MISVAETAGSDYNAIPLYAASYILCSRKPHVGRNVESNQRSLELMRNKYSSPIDGSGVSRSYKREMRRILY